MRAGEAEAVHMAGSLSGFEPRSRGFPLLKRKTPPRMRTDYPGGTKPPSLIFRFNDTVSPERGSAFVSEGGVFCHPFWNVCLAALEVEPYTQRVNSAMVHGKKDGK